MKKCVFYILLLISYSSVLSQNQSITADSVFSYYQSLLKKDSHSPFATYALAQAYFEKGEYKKTIEYSDLNLFRKNEYNRQVYLMKGISYERLLNPAEANAVYNKALKSFPDDYILLYQKAFSSYKLRQHEEAHAATNRVMSMAPLLADNYKLHACLLFENNNNKNCIYYLLYSLLITETKQESDPILLFMNNYLSRNFNNIDIPFYEKRYELSNVNEVLKFYSAKNANLVVKKVAAELPNELLMLDFNIESSSPLKDFYTALKNEKLETAFINYCLRFSDIEYVSGWIRGNKEELIRLANFLEKHLK